MSVDDLSISFASSMGIDNIKDEVMHNNTSLYTDLDDLEKSVEAEFEHYMSRARTFPFNRDPEDISNHSGQDMPSAELPDQEKSWHSSLKSNNEWKEEEEEQSRAYDGNTSPGAYFGARSLALDEAWNSNYQEDDAYSDEFRDKEPVSYVSFSVNSRHTDATDNLLNSRFKSLPANIRLFPKYELPDIMLHHPYTQKHRSSTTSSNSSTHQQCASEGKRNASPGLHPVPSLPDDEPPCLIEPNSSLYFLCEISASTIYAKVVHLKITNSSPHRPRTFSLFSSNHLLEFEVTEGVILEHETIDVKIKIQSSALSPYRKQQKYDSLIDKVLVLIDGQHATPLDVHIDFKAIDQDEQENVIETPKRPKCKYCALEKGYPLHCLQ